MVLFYGFSKITVYKKTIYWPCRFFASYSTSSYSPCSSSKPPVPKYNLVIDAPTEEQKKTRHFLAPPSQVMYIMADLTHADDSEDAPQVTPDERDEVVLCAIQVDESGVISVKPDFNDNTKPYRVESAVGRGKIGSPLLLRRPPKHACIVLKGRF